MMTKTAYYMQMAQEAAAQITGSKEQWTAFLTTSARLYKYPFAEQLMIYKQRPEATACAEYDLWNDRMNRYVKRGSKGIALLYMRGEQPKLRYVFDVADTGERKNSRPVQLWKMNAEHEQPIIRALDAAFDVPAGAGSLENHIMEAAERLARDYWEENRRQISDIVADSYLEGYDELNIGASFKRAAAVSIAYSVFTRTVGNADDYFEHEDFLDIFDFNTQAAANVLGTAVSEMSSQIFREIERTIRTYERDKQAERSQNYDGAELHEERRLPDSGHPVVGAGTEASGQVREDAQSIPAGEQHAAVQSPDSDREAVPAPVGDSGDRDRTDGTDDGGASESESGTGQEIEPDGLGAAHEHAESAGRGSHSDGTYQQLNFMSLFQSEAEQIQKIDAAAENAAREAESEKPSAFVISEDEIDRMLRTGSNFEGGKIRIYALYQQQGDAKERAAFLKAEYGLGGHSYTFMDGSRGFADYNGKGILLRNYDHDREVRLTWSAVDKRLDRLVENGQYLTALEMEEYRKLEQEYGASLPMPTAAHVFPPTPPERYDTGNEHVDNMLNTAADIYARSELAAPQRFTVMETDDGYAVWDDIQDGIHVEPDGVSEEFTSEWEAETYRQQLIKKVQEREAKDWLYVEQSKQDLQQDIPFPDVESEEVQESAHAETDPLVLEMQEHASELSRESGYAPDERFVVTMTGENFPDSKDAFAIWDYVKEEYYGYSDGKVQTFADYVSASEALQEIRGRNMEAEKEPATVQPEPAAPVQPDYRVGDTLYLDGKAFTIEKVGLFDVELRDPDSVYPIFRSESKENLARLLGHEDNIHLHNLVVDLNPGKEAAFRAEHEAKHAENYRINSFHLGEGSPKQKFRANMDAIYTLKALENQHRDATPEEQETLANYVGWGGLADAFDAEKTAWAGEYKELKAALTEEEYAAARASTLNAHYTSPTVIRAIYEALDGMGFEKGNILEPSMGVGNFFGMLPDSMLGSRLYGVELDSITGRIAQKLYPQAEIKVAGFETTDRRDFYDLAVGNVPFGNYRVSDKPYDKLGFSIHNYFFAKALDQVRPGGIVAFVTSRYTMDSKNPDARKYLAQRAELLGAIRLPNNAFRANAGTDVVSDIIFLQKRDHPIDIEPDWVHLGVTSEGITLNSYFVEHPEMVLGEITTESTQYGKEECTVIPIPDADLGDQLHEAVQHIGGHYEAQELAPEEELSLQGETIPADPMTAEWQITGKSTPSRNDVHAYMTYGTSRANAYRILEDTLNLRDIRIYDTVEDADGKQKRVLNKKETTLAQQKQQAIKDAFQNWVWKDPYRRAELVEKYNELFNSTRPREYDGSHIRFGGMNPEIRLREHQQNAIAHVLYGGNTLLAHEVGAGKTFEMAASAMEAKRLGLCQKSMFVVPNHLTLQWANEFLRLYPSAKLLVASKKDFETARRKKFCARIATGDYDAVIIGHSQFEKIPVSAERQERILTAQIDEIENAIAEMKSQNGERFSIKQMEKTRKGLEARLEKLRATDRKDDVITFEQLGVDRLFVDEAHAFKNLFLYTKMRNVAGLSTSEAQKSSDMFMKCQYMDELTGGRGIIFATGTPVSNSMTELYTMMRYLQYGTLQQKGLTHFDSWASTFGETTTAIELAPEGTGYRARTRFAKFFNLPELMNMFKEVADIKTSDQLHLPVPEAKFETVVVQPSEHQQAMVVELSERAAAVHSGVVDPSVDNMLKITSDGRKLGLDQRLMNPLLPDDPNSKLNACVRNVLRIYEEGQSDKLTQLLFCDLSTPKNDGTFNVYEDIRAKLIQSGVPEEEIAFIHDADTEAKKKDLFAKVRTGQVRVLLGSTQKMGAGTNVQDRLVAVHHLDVGWRPADMTQRNGRIIRQGNRNKEVQVYQYVTEGTFDAYLYQTLENKQKFISQIMTSKSPVRSCDDVDEQALSYAEIKALCAGDPQIKEKMDLDVDVARLKVLKADHQSQQYRLEDKLMKYFPAEIEKTQGFIKGFQSDIRTVAAHPLPEEGFCGMAVNGTCFTEKVEAGEAILAICKANQSLEPVPLGSYRGFKMELTFDSFQKEYQVLLKGEMTHRVPIGTSAAGNIQRLDNALAGIPARLEKAEQQLDNLRSQQEAAQAELGKPFPQEAELAEKSVRLAELDALLNMDDRGNDDPDRERTTEKPSVLAELRDRAGRIPPMTHRDDEEVAL